MKTFPTLVVAAAACLASAAPAADTLPAGILITGQVSGASAVLLGLDHLFANEPGTGTTALSAGELEFITADAAVGLDFFTDGRLQVWNNTGNTALAGSYTFTFSFAGLSDPITALAPLDFAQLTGGTVNLQRVNANTVSLTLDNLGFSGEFGSFTAQVVSAVPEPASLALMAAGLGLVALRRTRRCA